MKNTRARDGISRVQFDFDNKSLENLDNLLLKTTSVTRAELIRKALAVLTLMVEARANGDKIIKESKDGERMELKFLF